MSDNPLFEVFRDQDLPLAYFEILANVELGPGGNFKLVPLGPRLVTSLAFDIDFADPIFDSLRATGLFNVSGQELLVAAWPTDVPQPFADLLDELELFVESEADELIEWMKDDSRPDSFGVLARASMAVRVSADLDGELSFGGRTVPWGR